jgi:hypothetical protein
MHRAALFLVIVIFIAAFARADETWTGTADVKFHGYSTLHDFDGTVNKVPLKVTVSPGANGRTVSATSSAEVKDMSTANDKRDAGMWEMFQQAKYRFIKIEVPETPERTLKPGGGKSGSMPITLTIAGKRGNVTGTVTNVAEAATQCSFDLAFPVSLKAFSLEPPKAVGGLVKVKDTVDVKVRVALKKAGVK